MPQPDLVIGLDCSTTACKAVVWNQHGVVLASSRVALPINKPQPSWHEQPAEAWWTASAQALREAASGVDPARLGAVCIAPQRETFVLTDLEGNPLHNALLWMDERCGSLLPEINQLYGKERIHQETGKPLSANLTLGKLLWLTRHMPHLTAGAVQVNDVHAFLARRLTGRFATSWGCADPTGLFDMRQNCWNAPLIQAVGFQANQFPEALPVGEVIGEILPQAAQVCGLPLGIVLVAGLGDGQAAGLGVGVTEPGDAYLNLGTAVVSGTASQEYLVDPAFRTMVGGIPGSYILETVLLGGTYTITWFLDKFAGLTSASLADGLAGEAILEQEAALIPPGSNGLTLVPYWNSAMNPYWNAAASGIVVGWRGIHGRAHLYRAILEGIAFEQRLHTQGVEKSLGRRVEKFIAVGGGSRSPLWCQIIADITGRPVFSADAPEATALGAGILAAAAIGLHPGPAAAARAMTRISPSGYTPDLERGLFYSNVFEDVYQHLYPALQHYLDRLDALSIQS